MNAHSQFLITLSTRDLDNLILEDSTLCCTVSIQTPSLLSVVMTPNVHQYIHTASWHSFNKLQVVQSGAQRTMCGCSHAGH